VQDAYLEFAGDRYAAQLHAEAGVPRSQRLSVTDMERSRMSSMEHTWEYKIVHISADRWTGTGLHCARASATISSAASTFAASGFSTNTCAPLRSAAVAIAACVSDKALTDTTSCRVDAAHARTATPSSSPTACRGATSRAPRSTK
jgi:hypothetical protein